MIISLTGFMGCGKSSVGRELAALLSCPFTDLDSYIEEREQRRIPDIFAADGEMAFRRMELDALKAILGEYRQLQTGRPDLILSLGGGTLTTPECAGIIHDRTVCIYLRATIDTLFDNLKNDSAGRPMLEGEPETFRQRIERLMETRGPVYESTAHVITDIDGKSFTSVAAGIESMILHSALSS